jgi:hypothetical protein
MQVIQSGDRLLADSNDYVACVYACSACRPVGIDSHDLDGQFIGKIVQPDQTSIQVTNSAYEPKKAPPDPPVRD